MNNLKIFLLIFLQFNQILCWSNWALNQKCNPKDIIKPKSKKEIIDFIKKANRQKAKVRVVASGHSWSDIVCTNGYLVDLINLNKVLSVDKKNKTIKVQAGIKLCDLNKKLFENGLSLSNQPAIDLQTIGGLTATATHGTGHTGTMSTFIKDIELIDSKGKIHYFSDENNKDFMAAARVNIGSLGIIYSMTLKCEDAFEIKEKYLNIDYETFIKSYKKFISENDYFMFNWNPYRDRILAYFGNKIPRTHKTFEPAENCLGDETGHKDIHRQEEEIAIPVDLLSDAFIELKKFFKKHEKRGVKIFGDVFCRFVNADKNILLSPTAGRDSVFISINALPLKNIKNYDYKRFLKEFEDLLLKFNGRPHWGKNNFLDYNIAMKLYGKNLNKFIEIKKKLDPDKMFSNSFTQRVFNL